MANDATKEPSLVGESKRISLASLAFAWESYRPAVQERHARHDFKVFHRFVKSAQAAGHPVRGERVLDVGCGYRFPVTLLLHSFGARVTGIDTEFIARTLPLGQWRALLRQRGLVAFARRFVREAVHKRVYFRALEREFGRPLRFHSLDLRQIRIEDLHAEDEFDLIFSNAAFEHLSDVDEAIRIIGRALKPRGMAYISMHLFASLTGGHDVLSTPETSFVLFRPGGFPWRHLRDPNWKSPTFLNRWREDQYRDSIERHLKVREWKAEFWEPEEFLTEGVFAELKGYTREELMKRSIVVVAERPTCEEVTGD